MGKDVKRSYFIIILGVLFILAPFGNYLLSLFFEGIANWYHPNVWIEWLKRVRLSDIFVQLLILLSGIAIIIQAKWSWALTVLVLVLIVIYNLFLMIFDPSVSIGHLSNYVFIFATAGIMVLLFYFRYPYLDRRESIFGSFHQRFPTNKRINYIFNDQKQEGSLENISRTGFYVTSKEAEEGKISDKAKGVININQDLELCFVVMRITKGGFAGKFIFKDFKEKSALKQWINNL